MPFTIPFSIETYAVWFQLDLLPEFPDQWCAPYYESHDGGPRVSETLDEADSWFETALTRRDATTAWTSFENRAPVPPAAISALVTIDSHNSPVVDIELCHPPTQTRFADNETHRYLDYGLLA